MRQSYLDADKRWKRRQHLSLELKWLCSCKSQDHYHHEQAVHGEVEEEWKPEEKGKDDDEKESIVEEDDDERRKGRRAGYLVSDHIGL